jgi:hypothetical protein
MSSVLSLTLSSLCSWSLLMIKQRRLNAAFISSLNGYGRSYSWAGLLLLISRASEQDVTGLMLRCAEGATTNVLVVLAAPLPPRSHPKVTAVAGATTTEFIASVVTPGALVLLPEKASALVERTWQSVPELTVTIRAEYHSLRGVMPLEDLSNAMQTLQANCPKAVRGRK